MTTVTNTLIEQKLDDIGHQLDIIRREAISFKGYSNRQFAFIATEMATKDDLNRFATKDDLKGFATKDDLKAFATKEDFNRFATKDDLDDLTIIVLKIAEKVGVVD